MAESWNFEGIESLHQATEQIGGVIDQLNQLRDRWTDAYNQALVGLYNDNIKGQGQTSPIPDPVLKALAFTSAKDQLGARAFEEMRALETVLDKMLSSVKLAEGFSRVNYYTAQTAELVSSSPSVHETH